MRRSLLVAGAALAGALALGCGEQPAPSESAGAQRPALSTDQHAGGAGAVVIHGTEPFFVLPDPEAGLTVVGGVTFAEFEQFCATGEATTVSLERLFVTRPDGSVHTIVHGAPIPLLVWEVAITGPAELCGLLEVPHLTGTGQFNTTDNDLFTSLNRANAAHTALHGTVTSEAGERFRITGEFHAVVLPSGELHRLTFGLQLDVLGG